ncbi:MAG: DUF3164 family protein [Alistipes sp.]
MENINLKDLTSEQRKAVMEELKQQEAADKLHKENEIDTYKKLISEAVVDCFPVLQNTSKLLAETKRAVRAKFSAALAMKSDLYAIKEGQQSHTFISEDGRYRIRLGYNVVDDYDDTADAGVAIVKEYLGGLAAEGAGAMQAVKLALSLLSKDSKGTLKASRIMTLRKQALESGATRFIEGVDVIMNAYKPLESKQYIRAEYKNNDGVWCNVPLGMTEVE